MDFSWSSEQTALRERIESLCAEHCPDDRQRELEASCEFPRALHQALGAAGIIGYGLPAPYGAGGSLLDLALINETLSARAPVAVSPCFVNQVCGALLAATGTAEQKDRFLPGLAAGRLTFAFALTEPQAGSDAAAIALQAQRDGSDYLLNGSKLYATGCWDADYIITAVRTQPDGKASRGTSLICVPRDSDGLSLNKLDKLGGRNHASCLVEYQQVRVAQELRIGTEHGGWPVLMLAAGIERVCVAATCVGAVTAALSELSVFLQQREQFGQPIANFQAVRHKLADLATEAEAMRWLTYRAAWLAAQAGPAAAGTVSMAKLNAAEKAGHILQEVMKLSGGTAYLSDHPAPRRLRETMLSFYAGGTAEIQRELIARQVLGRP